MSAYNFRRRHPKGDGQRMDAATVERITDEQIQRARLTCAHHATDADDLRGLLEALGIGGEE